jgi:hypothetical protein
MNVVHGKVVLSAAEELCWAGEVGARDIEAAPLLPEAAVDLLLRLAGSPLASGASPPAPAAGCPGGRVMSAHPLAPGVDLHTADGRGIARLIDFDTVRDLAAAQPAHAGPEPAATASRPRPGPLDVSIPVRSPKAWSSHRTTFCSGPSEISFRSTATTGGRPDMHTDLRISRSGVL